MFFLIELFSASPEPFHTAQPPTVVANLVTSTHVTVPSIDLFAIRLSPASIHSDGSRRIIIGDILSVSERCPSRNSVDGLYTPTLEGRLTPASRYQRGNIALPSPVPLYPPLSMPKATPSPGLSRRVTDTSVSPDPCVPPARVFIDPLGIFTIIVDMNYFRAPRDYINP